MKWGCWDTKFFPAIIQQIFSFSKCHIYDIQQQDYDDIIASAEMILRILVDSIYYRKWQSRGRKITKDHILKSSERQHLEQRRWSVSHQDEPVDHAGTPLVDFHNNFLSTWYQSSTGYTIRARIESTLSGIYLVAQSLFPIMKTKRLT